MKSTAEQLPIINYAGKRLVVKAYAGCGKTTTLVAFAEANPRLKILYLAYNRAIRDEGQEKFPSNVACKTSHQLAWPQFGRNYQHKLGNLRLTDVAAHIKTKNWALAKQALGAVNAFVCSGDEQIGLGHVQAGMDEEALADANESDQEKVLQAANRLWEAMIDPQHPLPCMHDVYLKSFQLSKPRLPYDCILFDEAQDSNGVVAAIVAAQSSRVIFVGDKWQQIYRWRGAENALDREIEAGADAMYLTTSFRFGPMIAGVANAILRLQGETRPLVGLGSGDKVQTCRDSARAPYTILNRTVAGVIESALDAVADGYTVHWNGGIEAYNLSGLEDIYNLKKGKLHNIQDFRVRAFKSFDAYSEAAEGSEDPEMLRSIRIINDQADVPRMLAALRKHSTDDSENADIVVSTVHRSKGLEWNQVVLAEDFPDIFDPERVTPDQVADELNLLYVAVTRAKRVLVINSMVQQIIISAHRAAKRKAAQGSVSA